MGSNKIGQLRSGQGLVRIEKQREGGWTGDGADQNFEVGAELEPVHGSTDKPSRKGRWNRKAP